VRKESTRKEWKQFEWIHYRERCTCERISRSEMLRQSGPAARGVVRDASDVATRRPAGVLRFRDLDLRHRCDQLRRTSHLLAVAHALVSSPLFRNYLLFGIRSRPRTSSISGKEEKGNAKQHSAFCSRWTSFIQNDWYLGWKRISPLVIQVIVSSAAEISKIIFKYLWLLQRIMSSCFSLLFHPFAAPRQALVILFGRIEKWNILDWYFSFAPVRTRLDISGAWKFQAF